MTLLVIAAAFWLAVLDFLWQNRAPKTGGRMTEGSD
jgi:hypothetical protein